MSVDQSIISKLQKLHALAERAGTEHEAAVAAQRVAELLAKHNLDIGVLEKKEEQKGTSQSLEYTNRLLAYDVTLAHAVCEMLDCEVYINHRKIRRPYKHGGYKIGLQRRLVFVGLKSNVEAAIATHKYFQDSSWNMLDKRFRAGQVKGNRECYSYRMGLADRILEECRNLKDDLDLIQGEQCTALMVISKQVAKDFMETLGEMGTYHANNQVGDGYAYRLGHVDGGKVDLNGARGTTAPVSQDRMLAGGIR
jgi:hypothetical protein